MPLRLPTFLIRPPAKAKPRKPAAESLPATVEFASRTLPLVVRRHPRAKRLIMRLSPGATELSVTAPPKMSTRLILDFIDRTRAGRRAGSARRQH